MTVTPSSPVVGIFRDRSMAELAINALHNAGFTSEQVHYSVTGTSGSIIADLKSLFTGQNASSGNIANELATMGLSDEQAQYYANEYKNGNTLLVVSASNREQEVLNILHQYGAYNARTSNYAQQPSDSTQQAAYTSDETPLQQNTIPTWTPQEQPSDAENYPLQNDQPNVVPSTTDAVAQNDQPDEVPTAQNGERQPAEPPVSDYQPSPQDTSSPDASSLDELPNPQATSSDPIDSEFTTNSHDTPSEFDNPDTDSVYDDTPATTPVADATTEPQIPQVNADSATTPVADTTAESQTSQMNADPATTPVTDASTEPLASQMNADPATTPVDTTTEPQTSQINGASSEYNDELQQLQAQLQVAQQQLQDAMTQLKSEKERESHIQTIREHERQIQQTRQQLQEIQAQLQETLEELHKTRARISQYQ